MTNIEQSPYKLRSVGNTYQVELLDGRVIGWVGRHRRMIGRQVRWEYNARDADRVLLGLRSDTDDAIELVYQTYLASVPRLSVTVPGDGMWPLEVEFIARLFPDAVREQRESAIAALELWRRVHALDPMPRPVIEALFDQEIEKLREWRLPQ